MSQRSGGVFDLGQLNTRVAELQASSESEEIWSNPEKARDIMQELSASKEVLKSFDLIEGAIDELLLTLELFEEEPDDELIQEALTTLANATKVVGALEVQQKMSEEFDDADCILEINAGGGGTDAQDWASMLLRMYLRWCESKGFKVEQVDYQPSDVAGIKSVSLEIQGKYAFGNLRSERGVHRLVRISPFNANGKRQTSFASVTLTPIIHSDIDIDIEEKDLRIDTYRASGAGGQHVNKTDSAIRITHFPSGIVVACQNERSQHKNKDRAMKILKAKLYEMEVQRQKDQIQDSKGDLQRIDFGSQIRSYVIHPYQLVKDLRTGEETTAVSDVLDGKIDSFIQAYLLQGTS